MGLFVRQDEKRSELSERIAAELRERQKQAAEGGDEGAGRKHDNQAEDATMLQGQHKTNMNARVVVMIAIAVAILVLYLLVS